MLDQALITFSFDDGRLDNYQYAQPILEKYHLPATFNITTAYVERCMTTDLPTDVPAMEVDMVRELHRQPLFEIAGHGYYHFNDPKNICKGVARLNEILGTKQLTLFGNGFASPGTDLEMAVWRAIKSVGNDVAYARLSLRYKSYARLKTFLRKLSRLCKWPILYRLAYQDTLMDSVEDDLIYSVPVLSSTSVGQLTSVLAYAIKHHQACVLMLHSIVPPNHVHDNWDYESDKFEKLCAWIARKQQQGSLLPTTTMDIYQRLKATKHV